MRLSDFARLADSEDLRLADYASSLAAALLAFDAGRDLALTPGTGLGRVEGELRILVLVDSERAELGPGATSSLFEASGVRERVRSALGRLPEWSSRIAVLAVTAAP